MSRSVVLKLVAIFLTSIALVVTLGSAIGIIWLGSHGLYTQSDEEYMLNQLESISIYATDYITTSYNAQHYGEGGEELLQKYLDYRENNYFSYYLGRNQLLSSNVCYALHCDGALLESNLDTMNPNQTYYEFTQVISSTYPIVTVVGSQQDEALSRQMESQWDSELLQQAESAATTLPNTTEPVISVPEGYISSSTSFEVSGDSNAYRVYHISGPTYTVQLHILPEAWDYYESEYWDAVQLLYQFRQHFVVGVAAGLLIFICGIVYLCWVAGRRRGSDDISLSGLYRLPLDLYGVGSAGLMFVFGYLTAGLLEWVIYDVNYGAAMLSIATATIVSMILTTYICAIAAQVKFRPGYWWRHTLIGTVLRLIWRGLRWFFGMLGQLIRLLPIIWQWILTAAVMAFSLLLTMYWSLYSTPLPLLICIAVCIVIVCHGAYSFGVLAAGLKKMAQGNLNHKIPTKYLVGTFRDFANQLNTLADAAMLAAEKQTRSERMKTELITNVSHDIKTPLTSIINFSDLLQKPHTPEEEAQYLDVLHRQSQRLKRLIDDLMDLSKASTGNMVANITEMDAAEMVNQALGEFSDKLDSVGLTPVFRQPEAPVPILADGRLAWRVLSNLLSNAVKYALPGTRLYVDVVALEGKVLISMKNISREQLSVTAEELMERFVRGDVSRNTEGSGLGLNIARSLLEVQHGQLQLLVDGDLFKVTLVFPGAE